MVQPSQPSVRYEPTGGRTGSSGGWCLFREAQMRAVFVMVADVMIEQPFQMAFMECDDVVQEVAAAAFHPALRDAVLLRQLGFIELSRGVRIASRRAKPRAHGPRPRRA